ncbi:MAG: hypothetical protein ACREBU_15505 [Nitrososphaera sp.]
MLQAGPVIRDGTSTTIVMLSIAIAGGLLISTVLAGFIFKQPEVGSATIVALDPETEFEEGLIGHLVTLEFDQDTVQVSRGETVTIPFTISHKSHSFWQWITVTNFHQSVRNYVYGKYVEVDIEGVSPASAIIWPNSSVREEMTLSIPASAPDDIIGKSVTIGIQFDADVAFGGSYRGKVHSINLQIIE